MSGRELKVSFIFVASQLMKLVLGVSDILAILSGICENLQRVTSLQSAVVALIVQ